MLLIFAFFCNRKFLSIFVSMYFLQLYGYHQIWMYRKFYWKRRWKRKWCNITRDQRQQVSGKTFNENTANIYWEYFVNSGTKNEWCKYLLLLYGRLASPWARIYRLRIHVSAIQLTLFVTKTNSKNYERTTLWLHWFIECKKWQRKLQFRPCWRQLKLCKPLVSVVF